MRAELSLRPALAGNRRIVKAGLILCGLLAAPIVALLALEGGVQLACATDVVASGVAPGKIAWRISRMQCREGQPAFYDVALGALDKPMSTALTSRGRPVPLDVYRIDEKTVGVRLDAPRPGSADSFVPVRLRGSGSPRERIDLQADVAVSAVQIPR